MFFFWETFEKLLSNDDRVHVSERYLHIRQDLCLGVEADILLSSRFIEDPKGVDVFVGVELISHADAIFGYHECHQGRIFLDQKVTNNAYKDKGYCHYGAVCKKGVENDDSQKQHCYEVPAFCFFFF